VWALALSGLLAVAGPGVVARVRSEQAAGSQTQTQSQTAPPATPGQPGQRGHFDGPGGQFPGRGGPSNPSPVSANWDWWKDDAVKKEVGLRPEQASHIDRIYSVRMKEIDPTVQEYQKELDALDKMLADRVVDETALSVEMTKFYSLRTALQESRTLMLYRIEKVLDVDQYTKLKDILAQRFKEAEARRGRGGGYPIALPR
jgi:Spy/CpxP family protein refolding chaperone